jgi:hypothetical protein
MNVTTDPGVAPNPLPSALPMQRRPIRSGTAPGGVARR